MQPKQAFLVGLTSILGVIILAGLLMVFGEFDRWLVPSYALEIRTNNAAGLRSGSTVSINGVRIGQVERVELGEDELYPIRVVALIGREQLLPVNTTFEINQPLLGGSSVLALKGNLASDVSLPTDGSASISGSFRSLVDRLNEQLAKRFDPLVSAMDSFSGLSETLQALADDFRRLTAVQDPAAIDAGEPANLRTAIARLNTVLDQTTRSLSAAEEWLGDESMRDDAREAVRRAGTMLDDASATMRRYATLADSLEADADRLLTEMRPVLDQLSVTIEQLRLVASTATDGSGTVAQLLNNPDLYRSLDDAAIRLERVLSEMQLLIQKVKAEGLPIEF